MSAAGKGSSAGPKGGKDGKDKTVAQAIGAVTASGILWSLYKSFRGRPAEKIQEAKFEETLEPSKSRPRLDKQYEVLKGDTLWGISRRYGVTVVDMKEANAIEDVDFILTGQSLIIPQ